MKDAGMVPADMSPQGEMAHEVLAWIREPLENHAEAGLGYHQQRT